MYTSENLAEVKLKALLEHTAERLLMSLPDEAQAEMPNELTITSKWGCDGSSGHSEYKQNFSDWTASDRCPDETVFWQNATPSSTRLCRPIRFELAKEIPAVIEAEFERMSQEIPNLGPISFEVRGESRFLNSRMSCSMIDGEVLQILNDTPGMQNCSLSLSLSVDLNVAK